MGAGREELLALAGNDQRVDVFILIEFIDKRLKAGQGLDIPGIGGGIGDPW